MQTNLICDGKGEIVRLALGGVEVPFRADRYGGPALCYLANGEVKAEFSGAKGVFRAQNELFEAEKRIVAENGALRVRVAVTARSRCFSPRVFLRMGIDAYMERFPDWNEKFFPTFLRAERTHFLGCLQDPQGRLLALACETPLVSWSLDYNRADYGGEDHVGHRVYTFCVDLHNEMQRPLRAAPKAWEKGETRVAELVFRFVEGEEELFSFWHETTGCALLRAEKYTLETGERIALQWARGDWKLYSPAGKEIPMNAVLTQTGQYRAVGACRGKQTEALFTVREDFAKTLKFAAEAVFRYPQKPSTHCETYYGYFSGFAYAKRSGDAKYLKKLRDDFDAFYADMTLADGELSPSADPERVQNLSTLVSLLADAFEATGDEKYLERARVQASALMRAQSEDGAYRCGWNNAHYTCVIYPAKSLFELYFAMKGTKYAPFGKQCFDSASRAAEDLARLMDDIRTEGEQTFEDGMISCESLQLALYALLCEERRKALAEKAGQILQKHACLEQRFSWDSRVRGCTIRFWETMYDVLIDKNMIVSPHGWTSWKTYATYYLYLLTRKEKYLLDTMDTLGACMQCVGQESGELRWGFALDPCVPANVFVPAENGAGKLQPAILGEDYIPMISDWWRAEPHRVVKGFAQPAMGRTSGVYRGGCCDNDVHEHFKCLDEIGFNAFVHQRADGSFLTYNCRVEGNTIEIKGKYTDKLFVSLQKAGEWTIDQRKITLKTADCISILRRI